MSFLRITVFACMTLLAGCAVDKYQEAAPSFSGTPVPRGDTEVVVLFQPIFAGKPFSETVCDNTVGVSWSPEESRHIGLTGV
jgi:hypothetical protein